jgi:uncharacterized membrane-anchored protein YhcB (DUF1043 family)
MRKYLKIEPIRKHFALSAILKKKYAKDFQVLFLYITF